MSKKKIHPGLYGGPHVTKSLYQKQFKPNRKNKFSLRHRLTDWQERTANLFGSKKRIGAAIMVAFLIFLSTSMFYHEPITVHATTVFNAKSHTFSTIYSTSSSLGGGIGAVQNQWKFNYSQAVPLSGVQPCIELPSSTQLRFKYDIGKSATNFGPFDFAVTDYGNGIDIAQQPKLFFAQTRWWVFYMNGTGGSPVGSQNKIIFTSSTTGSNATGSWAAPVILNGAGGTPNTFAAPLDYSTANNSTDVILQYTSSGSTSSNDVLVVDGKLNAAGTITWGTPVTAMAHVSNANFVAGYIFTNVQLGGPALSNRIFVTAEADAYTPGLVRTSINATGMVLSSALATVTAFTNFRAATGANITGPPLTRWFMQSAAMNNTAAVGGDDDMIQYSSGTQTGQLGVYVRLWDHTNSSFDREIVVDNGGLLANPQTGGQLFTIGTGELLVLGVKGTTSEINQTVNEAIWTGGRSGSWTPYTHWGQPVNKNDLSQGNLWDSKDRQFWFLMLTAGTLGVNGWFSNNVDNIVNGIDTPTFTNRQNFFPVANPTSGNVSTRFNRNMNSQIGATTNDGTYRFGFAFTEGAGTVSQTANGYKLAFGSILLPSGTPQYGNNCNSADIAIVKAPFNLQSANGKQLDIFWSAGCTSSGVKAACLDTDPDLAAITIGLRTNSTLPGFNEGYNMFNDPAVRMTFRVLQLSNGRWGQDVYVAKGQTNSINSEGAPSDLIITQSQTLPVTCAAGTVRVFSQVILNFTGPNNEMDFEAVKDGADGTHCGAGTNIMGVDSTTGQAATALQLGQDYNLIVQVSWGAALIPAAGEVLDFTVGQTETTQFPKVNSNLAQTTSAFYSVPAYATDLEAQHNDAIALSSTPIFQVNPLDPSSWANAIIKGLTWVGTNIFAAIGQMLSYAAPVFIAAFDNIGGFLGIGPLGTNIANFFSSVVNFFNSVVANSLAQAIAFFAFIGSGWTAIVSIFGSGWTALSNFANYLAGFLGVFWTVWSLVFPLGKVGIGVVFFSWWAWGMFSALAGMEKFKLWLDVSSFFLLKMAKLAAWGLEETAKGLARLRTILPHPA